MSAILVLAGCETTSDGASVLGGGLGAIAGYAVCRVADANDSQCAMAVLTGVLIGYSISSSLLSEPGVPEYLESSEGQLDQKHYLDALDELQSQSEFARMFSFSVNQSGLVVFADAKTTRSREVSLAIAEKTMKEFEQKMSDQVEGDFDDRAAVREDAIAAKGRDGEIDPGLQRTREYLDTVRSKAQAYRTG